MKCIIAGFEEAEVKPTMNGCVSEKAETAAAAQDRAEEQTDKPLPLRWAFESPGDTA